MARMIDADVAIKRFRGWLESPHGENVYHSGYDDAIWHVLDVIEHMPTLTQPNEWVSVEERLPTDERPVLVFVGYADTMTGFITTSSYFCFDANPHWQWDGLVRDEQRTLFWMPLPDPPDRRLQEGEEET